MTIEASRVELYLNQWVDITHDVSYDPGLTITTGRDSFATQVINPSIAKFTLRNGAEASQGAGTWDPRWPASPYYGIWGEGVRCRIALKCVTDTFARTVSNGWGTSDSGYAWTNSGGSASDYSVSSGTANHHFAAVGDRVTYLGGFSQHRQRVQVEWSLPFSSATGAVVYPAAVMTRVVDTSNYALTRVQVDTSGAISVLVFSVIAGVETQISSTVVTGLTYTSGQKFRTLVVHEGQTVSAKVWLASGNEPYAWHYQYRVPGIDTPGGVGLRSSAAVGNTNITFDVSVTAFEVLSPRHYGEVSGITQQEDLSQRVRTAEVEVTDQLARLANGSPPIRSTLRRSLPSQADLIAYWPGEDGKNASVISAGISGIANGEVSQGAVNFAADSFFACSSPLFSPNKGTAHFIVPTHTLGYETVRFLFHMPNSGIADATDLCVIHTQGTLGRWALTYGTGGTLKLTWQAAGTIAYVGDSGLWGFAVDGDARMLSIELRQNGSGIDWSFVTVVPGATAGAAANGTIASQTLGVITDIYLTPDMNAQNISFGHVHMLNVFHSIFEQGNPLYAWRSEYAYNRFSRLCTEQGIGQSSWRSPQATEAWLQLGPQQINGLTDIWEESAYSERALLNAARGTDWLLWRTHPNLEAQTPRATLAVTQLAASPLPVDDDKDLTNSVTATRGDGGEFTYTITSGQYSASYPPSGIGPRAKQLTMSAFTDLYLQDFASWYANAGTYQGPRYPRIVVKRHTPGVTSTAAFGQLLDIEVGDIVSVTGLRYGDDIVFVEGVSEFYNGIEHIYTINASPGRIWDSGPLDDSNTRADASTSTLASSMTSGATSMSVASTSPVWIDSTGYAAQFPFYINVGGEIMSVTAISGTTSPQTFTVTRGVNGVAVAHGSGASVVLAYPTYFGSPIQT